MAWGLRDHQKVNVALRIVEYAVWDARRNLQSLMDTEGLELSLHVNLETSGKNEEKLPRDAMEVPHFARAGGHALCNHGKPLGLEQVPAVAALSPGVVFCGIPADHVSYLCRSLL